MKVKGEIKEDHVQVEHNLQLGLTSSCVDFWDTWTNQKNMITIKDKEQHKQVWRHVNRIMVFCNVYQVWKNGLLHYDTITIIL